MESNKIVRTDILRYKKNKLAANLALLGLVFNCLYFMLLYGIKATKSGDTVTRFANIQIGFSVILTLVTLLLTFLASEGIKGYNKKFAYVLVGLAVFQIIRIFGYPLYGLKQNLLTVDYFGIDPKNSGFEFALLVIYLCASAACLVASAVIGFIRAVRLEKFQKQLDNGELSMEEVLLDLEREDEAKAQAVANLINENPAVDGVMGTVHEEITGDEAVILPESKGEVKPTVEPVKDETVIISGKIGKEEVQ